MDRAVLNGHIDVVEWLQENCTEGCTTEAMDKAALGDHLELVKWLKEHIAE